MSVRVSNERPVAQSASGRPAQGIAFHLLRYFSITSGIAILLVSLLLSWTYYKKEIDDQLKSTEARNVVLAQTVANAIWPDFGDHILRRFGSANQRRDDAKTRALRDRLISLSNRVPVVKIKIFNSFGVTVYSSVLEEIGEEKSANGAFQAARTGKMVSELTRKGETSVSEGDVADADVISSYIPIAGDKNEVHAVFELYSDVSATISHIQQSTLRLQFGLLSIFAALYAFLLLIVGRADRILQRQYKALKSNEELISAKNEALEFEIAARRTVEIALRQSEDAAANANRAKTEFLSNMSHELRTPMNAILGFSQLLLSEKTNPIGANQRQFVEQILKAGRHLLALINEVLDLARIESGKLVLSVEPVSVASVLDECLPLIQNTASEMELRVEPLPAGVDINVMADYIRLKQVLLNLLSNAVKYNHRGGRVSVSVMAASGGFARISVSDTGLGIPEALQNNLFQPFQRLVPDSSVIEGTGVGLALTRNLVSAMNGQLGFQSIEGAGSTFWVEIPIAPIASPGALPLANGEQAAAGGGEIKGSILYIEDNPANVLLMEQIARRLSIRFVTAHNAEMGITLAVSQQPDLVVMDINLPQMNGYEALRCLRENPVTAAIPVIALSANAMPRDVERGLEAGFLRYHTKPIDIETMMTSIRQILGEPK